MRCCGHCCPTPRSRKVRPALRRTPGNPRLVARGHQQSGAAVAGRLQFMGQLYYLTLNNEPLVTALLTAERAAADPRPTWPRSGLRRRQMGAADRHRVRPVPGATPASRPPTTRSCSPRRSGSPSRPAPWPAWSGPLIAVTGNADIAELVAGFLTANQATFEIGAEPVRRTWRAPATAAPADVVAQVSRLQRVCQLTLTTRA